LIPLLDDSAATGKEQDESGRDFRLLGDITLGMSSGYGRAASSWFVVRFATDGHRYRVVVVQTESGLPPLGASVEKGQNTAAAEIRLTPRRRDPRWLAVLGSLKQAY
jgi:hypothetical protein